MAAKKFIFAALTLVFLFSACGDDSSGQDVVSITDKTISGVSQKGPFVKGSAVKLYELDGETIAQTGKSFTGKIASDDGKFTVSSVSLVSQYALLEANGYFRNEITGDKSSGTITLNALTDLRNREKVNINLLTHLEYERALYLVGTGDNVSEAKNQAEAEILNAFGIEGDFDNSEDLDIFSSGDGNAALLAFSVLMLGDLSEADLTERLTNFATDIETGGRWDDETTKTAIADWAFEKSLNGELATIRDNIASWKLSDEVPAFEKYVDNFWWQIYGLGSCNENHNGDVMQNSNEKSKMHKKDFICENHEWRVTADVELDTYKWEPGKDGDVKNGDIVETNCYVYEDSSWQRRAPRNCFLKTGCTIKREGEINKESDTTDYICHEKNWIAYRDVFVDQRDNREYFSVRIGSQIWMSEDLDYSGSNVEENTWRNGEYRWYNWGGEINEICPEGWHIPSKDEWLKLVDFWGGPKESFNILSRDVERENAEREYNFYGNDMCRYVQACSDFCIDDSLEQQPTSGANYWTSTEVDEAHAYYMHRYLPFDAEALDAEEVLVEVADKRDAIAIRCIKDEE